MKSPEKRENKKELTEQERDLIMKTSAEFLQADKEELIQLVLKLMNEKGQRVVKNILKMGNREERVAFVGYLLSKTTEEHKRIVGVIKKIPAHTGFIGIGGHHEILSFYDRFLAMIERKPVENKEIYFKEKPIF